MTKTVQHRLDRLKNPTAIKRRQRRNKTAKVAGKALPTATLSTTTRERLLAQACNSPLCEGMSREAIVAWLDERIAVYLADQPWWFGQMRSADRKAAQHLRRHQINNGQIEANEQPLHLRRIQDEYPKHSPRP